MSMVLPPYGVTAQKLKASFHFLLDKTYDMAAE